MAVNSPNANCNSGDPTEKETNDIAACHDTLTHNFHKRNKSVADQYAYKICRDEKVQKEVLFKSNNEFISCLEVLTGDEKVPENIKKSEENGILCTKEEMQKASKEPTFPNCINIHLQSTLLPTNSHAIKNCSNQQVLNASIYPSFKTCLESIKNANYSFTGDHEFPCNDVKTLKMLYEKNMANAFPKCLKEYHKNIHPLSVSLAACSDPELLQAIDKNETGFSNCITAFSKLNLKGAYLALYCADKEILKASEDSKFLSCLETNTTKSKAAGLSLCLKKVSNSLQCNAGFLAHFIEQNGANEASVVGSVSRGHQKEGETPAASSKNGQQGTVKK